MWLRTMSGISPNGVMGAKMIAAATRHRKVSYLIPLFDKISAELLALLDGNSITGFRTAATSALAVDAIASPGALQVGFIGSGFEAKNHLRALAAIRNIESVVVFSPNPASRLRFVSECDDLCIPIRAATNAREVADVSSLLICAARSRDETPTLQGRWVRRGTTIVSIGSTIPEQREIDPEVVARSDIIVADMVEEVIHDTGDMLAAAAAGVEYSTKMVSLAAVISGQATGRISDNCIVLYKSVGSAMQDLVVAETCMRRAEAVSLGTKLPVTITSVQKGK